MATITRARLSDAVYGEVGLSRDESSALVDSVLDKIAATLAAGESVKLSSFGSFIVRDKAERVGRNPKTGVEAAIAARRVVVFRASHALRIRVEDGGAPSAR